MIEGIAIALLSLSLIVQVAIFGRLDDLTRNARVTAEAVEALLLRLPDNVYPFARPDGEGEVGE